MALDGDTIVFSSRMDDQAGTDSGAAYVYIRDNAGTPGDHSDDSWQEQAKLIGRQVAILNATAIITVIGRVMPKIKAFTV